VTEVVVDSRVARTGSLFVALRGERRDGHDFAAGASAAGASVLVRRGSMPAGACGVEVADTGRALLDLAVRRRGELTMPVAAITGSNGKTTTKDLLVAALGPGAHGSPRSFNNEIGVPLTILGAPAVATGVVAEVGSRGVGDIALLVPAVRPTVAVITNVGRAHLETFGDVATVLAAKWELVEALGEDGIAVLPADDTRLTGKRRGSLITFGESAAADVAVSGIAVGPDGRASCVISYSGAGIPVTLAAAGRHQPRNLSAAVAAAVAMGIPFPDAAERAAAASGSAWRMEVHRGPVTIVNDSYNANPDSMAAALSTVAAMGGRHIAVLGRMRELGEAEFEAHREAGERARRLGFAAVIVVGEAPGLAEGAGPIARIAADADEAERILRRYIAAGDVILVKASRAEGLEVLAERLRGGVG
jgi:UDP-N-acetylmuramoyl-tripeptide--D-alanyl-D-alanine ligase